MCSRVGVGVIVVFQDYLSHSDRILSKIVSIVMDLFDKSCVGLEVMNELYSSCCCEMLLADVVNACVRVRGKRCAEA